MKKILLVGNGSSMLDSKRKDLIDSYDTVVRFNSYKIEGYEEYVGTKTDIWFTCNMLHINEIDVYSKVLFHSWAHENDCKIYKQIKETRPDAVKIPKDIIKSIPVKTPSTGLIAIYYFNFQVDIIGFDWWDKDKHHYGDNEQRGTVHKPEEEYKIIKQLGIKIIT
jgi:hypothetical protein